MNTNLDKERNLGAELNETNPIPTQPETLERGGCGYQGYEFGAGTYPDSVCIEGTLYDADDCDDQGNLYERGEDIPCPVCRSAEAIDWWTDHNSLSGVPRYKARRAAKNLIADILKNRGLLAEEQN